MSGTARNHPKATDWHWAGPQLRRPAAPRERHGPLPALPALAAVAFMALCLTPAPAGATTMAPSNATAPATALTPRALTASEATPKVPGTRVGKQLEWLLGAASRAPLSNKEIEAHFDAAFRSQVSPAAINQALEGLAPSGSAVTLLQLSDATPASLEALVRVGSARYTVQLSVDATGLIAGLLIQPASSGASSASDKPPTSAQCMKQYGVACYSPKQLQTAYDLAPLYARGFDGKGETIVIVDPFGSPTLRKDLATFDRALGLPAPPSLRVLQPVGKVPAFNAGDSEMVDKAGETTGDVETAHEIAPGANLVVVETPVAETATGGGFPQFMAAENYVVEHNLGDVISQCFGLPEQNFGRSTLLGLRYAFVNAQKHHVTVLAASNDTGVTGPTPNGALYDHPIVDWPSSDPLVTAVGGTTLHLNTAGERTSPDTAWNDGKDTAVMKRFGTLPWASTGGLSVIFKRPAYQSSVRATVGDHRGVPDIAMSASLSGSVLLFGSFTGTPVWGPGGGTSAATPEFAGIVAIADQYAGKRLGLINPALYRMQEQRAPGIIDVTRGDNTVSFVQDGATVTVKGYPAKPGYDLVTGVGTLNAALFVAELAKQG
jgi:subtilase family serine protease